MATTSDGHLEHIEPIAKEDAAGLLKAHESYGNSWKKRGGTGAYHVMIRKFDRMENMVKKFGYNIVAAVKADQRPEGLTDDIRDARRYLMLIESWLRELGLVKAGDHRDNAVEGGVPRSYSDLDVPLNRNQVPHIKGCGCDNCTAVTRLIKKTMDQLKKETEAEKCLYEDNPHPHIKGCVLVKESIKQTADRLKKEQIELAAKDMARHKPETYDGPCSHECDHPACQKARGRQNGWKARIYNWLHVQ